MKIFAAQNPHKDTVLLSSSGGVYSLLAEEVLNKDGVVYGAVFNSNWNIYHKRIESFKDLEKLYRSKYAYSNLENVIDEIAKDLEEGKKVMFCSVPCQVAAIHKKFTQNPNLLLIELVCHGAPEQKYWERYLKSLCNRKRKTIEDIESINFRDKRTGWKNYSFTVKFRDGSEYTQPHDENLYMRVFLKNYTLREACFKCHFKYPNGSKADITLGDFWGVDKIAPELDDNLGVSVIFARTTKGEQLIQTLKKHPILDFESIIRYNPAIVSSAERPKDYENFKNDYQKDRDVISLFKKYTKDPLLLRIKIFAYKLLRR